MPNFRYTTGLSNVGPFQVSGMPFVTGAVDCKDNEVAIPKISFPYVTKWIYVVNNDPSNDLKVGFSKNGVDASHAANNYFTVAQGAAGYNGTFLELKLSQLWISGSTNCDIVAGLTTIPTARIDNISPSGSNWSGSYDFVSEGYGLG